MPTPIDLLLDPISLAVFAIYAALMLWETLAPARVLPRLPGWPLRATMSFAAYFLLSSYLPLLWDAQLARWQLVDLTTLGTWGGAAAGLLVYELAAYGWHRSMHASARLWRLVHQMHHSAERLDTWSAFWFGPLDMIGWTALSSASLVLAVGLTPQAATVVLLTVTTLAIFQHTNIRTPRWAGYLVQRPEQHRIHHGRGVHAHNYADLALIDMLFGSWRNPADAPDATGFHHGASTRLAAMMLGRDISTATDRRAGRGALAPLGYAQD